MSSRPSVDISIQVAPFRIAGSISNSTASETAGDGRQVITASDAAATSAGFAASVAPIATWRAASAGLRS